MHILYTFTTSPCEIYLISLQTGQVILIAIFATFLRSSHSSSGQASLFSRALASAHLTTSLKVCLGVVVHCLYFRVLKLHISGGNNTSDDTQTFLVRRIGLLWIVAKELADL